MVAPITFVCAMRSIKGGAAVQLINVNSLTLTYRLLPLAGGVLDLGRVALAVQKTSMLIL